MSGQGEKQNALRAVGAGAYDFLCKPVDMDELKLVLQRSVYVAELEQEYRAMQQGLQAETFEGCSVPALRCRRYSAWCERWRQRRRRF